MYLPVSLFVYLSLPLFIFQIIFLSLSCPICISLHPYAFLSPVYLYISPCSSLSLYISIPSSLSFFLHHSLSLYLSIPHNLDLLCPSLSLCLSFFISLSIPPFISLMGLSFRFVLFISPLYFSTLST